MLSLLQYALMTSAYNLRHSRRAPATASLAVLFSVLFVRFLVIALNIKRCGSWLYFLMNNLFIYYFYAPA
jgi:hypothetical protein